MAKKKVKKMTDTKVTHVSLVGNPANDIPFLAIKSNSDICFNLEAEIAIKSAEQQLVYGIVYEPDRIDLQGEFMSAEDIQKSAHGFISDFGNIDANHDFESQMGVPVESYIAPQDFDIEGKTVKAGSWVLVVKCNDEAWEQVKKGEFGGFSLAGTTRRQEVEVDVDEGGNILKSMLDKVVSAFTRKEAPEPAETELVSKYIDLFLDTILDACTSEKIPETEREEVQKKIATFHDRVSGLSFVTKEGKREGENVEETQKKLEELSAGIDSLKAELESITKSFEVNAEVLERLAGKIVEVEKSALNSQQVVTLAAEEPANKSFNIVRGVQK